MRISLTRRLVALPLAVMLSFTACAQQADLNEIGKRMSMMLQNDHFARLRFDAKLGERFMETYLTDLDGTKLYFTQADIDGFREKYGDRMEKMLIQANFMPAATEIYRTFEKRVEERTKFADALLADHEFDFTRDETVKRSRAEESWPANEEEANDLWRRQIKEAILSESLRRDMVHRMAVEQGKADPSEKDRDPKEKISLRYKRFLASTKDVDEEDIANLFLSSVARSYDPHTDYMSPRAMERFRDGMRAELVGIGALLQSEEDGATKIMGIVVGGPADSQGSLKLNDRVVGVDSLSTGDPADMVDIMFLKIEKVVDLIRGEEGTEVSLKVEPAGAPAGETKIITIKRDKVEMKDEQASAEIIQIKDKDGGAKRIGVLKLPSFYADFENGSVRSSVDVERLLNRLIQEEIDGLVMDIRGNGGGSLEEVRRMTGFFIPRGPVVQVKNTFEQVSVKESDLKKPIYDGPMVVITDKASASASEILAGALQDYNRAVVIGDSSTFGKGTVQQPLDIGQQFPLFAKRDRAGFLKVTIQKFYRPSGSSTQMEGVVPQIVLPSFFDALDIGEADLKFALPHDRIRPAPDFHELDGQRLFIERLSELSAERLQENKDFEYIREDVAQTRERIENNEVSLNMESRRAELAEGEATRIKRNSERRERFAKLQDEDKKNFEFTRLTLDDLDSGVELKAYDPSVDDERYMRRAEDETAALDDSPKWPSGLDLVKREALMVARDLVDLTENARVAGLLNGAPGGR